MGGKWAVGIMAGWAIFCLALIGLFYQIDKSDAGQYVTPLSYEEECRFTKVREEGRAWPELYLNGGWWWAWLGGGGDFMHYNTYATRDYDMVYMRTTFPTKPEFTPHYDLYLREKGTVRRNLGMMFSGIEEYELWVQRYPYGKPLIQKEIRLSKYSWGEGDWVMKITWKYWKGDDWKEISYDNMMRIVEEGNARRMEGDDVQGAPCLPR